MIAKRDAKRAEDIATRHSENDPGPAEKPRQYGQQCDKVIEPDGNCIGPDDLTQIYRSGQGQTSSCLDGRGRWVGKSS